MNVLKFAVFTILLATTLFGTDGKTLYDGKCKSCHGASGQLKALGKSRQIGGLNKNELNAAMKGYKAGTLDQYGMGSTMKRNLALISDSDARELTDYISKLQPK